MSDANSIVNVSLLDPPSSLISSNHHNSTTSTTQNNYQYISPLEQTLSDLRRKYVAAAGPQVGTAAAAAGGGSSSSSGTSSADYLYSGDVDFDDISKRLGEEETNKNWMMLDKRRSAMSNAQNLASGYSRCISTANLSASINNRSLSMSAGSSPRSSTRKQLSSATSPPMDKRKSTHNHHHMHHVSSSLLAGSFLEQESAAFMDSTNRHKSGLASTSHAENLLACAPHLRHLSAASAGMQGGNFKSSRNPLTYLLAAASSVASAAVASSTMNTGRDTKTTGGDMNSGSNSGGGPSSATNANSASMADYGTCLARDRANGRVALKLAAFVRVLSHEMSLEEFAAVEAEIFSHILSLMHSSDSNERLAGVAAIDALIGVPSADEEKKSTMFAKNLSYGMKAVNVEFLFLSGVTRSLGKIFLGSSNVDYVECEVIRAMEWLRIERSDRRLAAVLTIKELAQNAPAAFYSKMNQTVMGQGGTKEFLTQIFPALRDPQPIVRACAADALAECLKIIVDPTRKHHSTTGILCQIYSYVMNGFKDHTKTTQITQSQAEAAQHSSLLIVGDMLECAGTFMLPRFDEVCDAVLALKFHSKELLKLEVVRLIPRLARRCPGSYTRRHLGSSLKYVMDCASKAPTTRSGVDLRPTAYFALGQLVLAVSEGHGDKGGRIPQTTLQIDQDDELEEDHPEVLEGEIKSIVIKYHMKKGDIYANLDQMFQLVRNGLGFVQSEALHCGADLVQALGSYATLYVSDLLNDMFKSGLCEDLICCLHAIAYFLPSEMTSIENRLMEELSLGLAGTTAVKQLCDPLHASANTSEEVASGDFIVLQPSACPPSITINMSQNTEVVVKLVLSLRTLGTLLNMKGGLTSSQNALGWTLLPFIRDVVSCYLLHPSCDVRREAALTCCLLLLPENEEFDHNDEDSGYGTNDPSSLKSKRLGPSSVAIVEEVMQKLLCVAVSDASPIVRNSIIRAFDERFDPYLCQSQHLPPLFLSMQDEALAVRAAALRLLGRLARLNPAPILPELRQVLMELIIELRCNGDTGGGKEAATRLLIVFFKADALHRLVHPFLHSIIDALPLRGATPRLATAALEALGELSQVVKEDFEPWLHQLLPLIMETMQDQSSSNRQRTSLKTLGQISGSTKYVIDPYLEYPQLLSQAAAVLPGTKRAPWALRQEVIRTLGILGALDPDRYPTTTGSKSRKGGGIGSGYFVDTDEEKSKALLNRRVCMSLLTGSKPLHYVKRADEALSQAIDTKRFDLDKMQPYDGLAVSTGLIGSKDDGDDPAHLYMYELYSMTAQPISKISPARRLTPTDDNFYPTVALQALTTILKDPSLAVHHGMVMQAVMYIFNSLGLRCVPFLKGIVPHILYTARTCGQVTLREALLQQVASLSGIVRENLRPYVPDIFEVVQEFWNSKHLATVLILVQKIAAGVPADFREYVPDLVSRFLSSIDDFSSGNWMRNGQTSHAVAFDRLELITKSIRALRNTLGDYMHVILPALLKLADSLINPTLDYGKNSTLSFSKLAVDSIQTIAVLLQSNDSDGLMGIGSSKLTGIGTSTRRRGISLPARAAQPLIRMLGKAPGTSKETGYELIQTICVCAEHLGKERWIPLYHVAARDAIVSWHHRVNFCSIGIQNEFNQAQAPQEEGRILMGINLYDELMKQLVSRDRSGRLKPGIDQDSILKGIALADNVDEIGSNGMNSSTHALDKDIQSPSIQPIANQANKHRVNQVNLQRAWDVSQRATREEWDEWMRRFAVQLLREAPAPALRACAELAYAYQPLARELFSAAFASCWAELNEQYRLSLVNAMKIAFFAEASPEILQTLLNLAEYAERDGVQGGIPIEINVLAELALKCRSYAKALHYKELEHELGGGSSCIEDLISINKKLDLPEAALGVLKAAQLEMERHGAQSWGHLSYTQNTKTRNQISSRIFHRHQGEGLVYSVMASSDDIAAQGNSAWAGVDMQASWLAKLGSWSDALAMYERKLEEDPDSIEAVLGCMKCLDARGEWKGVLGLWDVFSNDVVMVRDQRKASRFCAQAAYRLGRWDDLEMYSAQLIESRHDQYQSDNVVGAPRVDFDGAFFSAIVNIHRKEWTAAAAYIDGARRAMDSRFTALMAESHKRAYPSMVTAQTLAEMEEIITYRKMEERAKAGSHRHPANKGDVAESRRQLVSLWRKRLAGCRVDAEVHSSILAVRSLVLGPTDEVQATLTLSALSRQAQSYKLGERVLLEPLEQLGVRLDSPVFGFNVPGELGLGLLTSSTVHQTNAESLINQIMTGEVKNFFPPYGNLHDQYTNKLILDAGDLERIQVEHKLYYAYVKYLWGMNQSEEAMSRLTRLANVVDMIAHCNSGYGNNLRVKCWLKLGEWKIIQSPPGTPLSELSQRQILLAFKRSIAFTSDGYRAWHNWALINFRLAQQNDESRQNVLNRSKFSSFANTRRSSNFSSTLRNHVATAVHAFIKAICLGTKRWSASVQQDLLNFLSCLFRYGESKEVASVINAEVGSVALEAWLGVLPQLLARIQINSPIVRSILHPLLIRLGKKHPQALMYPLSVLVKSPVDERKEAADNLMNSLKKHSFALVGDALMVSSELIRVAILWLELWHEGLEDASRLYFGEGNVSGMLDVLLPLHETLERGPSTKREQDFHRNFGEDLAEAHSFVKEYMRLVTRDGGVIPKHGGFMPSNQPDGLSNVRQKAEAEAALNHSWDLYYTVFRRINKQLPGLTTLELSHCSPALLQARNLELGVPGSYRVDGSYVKIERFYPTVQVITSKQRPRKIVLRGGDGKDYVFLLKGHEDLRQDERVMQLFGLVNALLVRDRRTNNHDLNIQRYTITPLSHNAGVVGWVPHTDTLHSLIRDYRESKRIPVNMENREMLKLAFNYDLLTVMQKIEVFSEALDQTTGKGNDLYEVLWAKSINSEEWLDRRTKFTRSLAVMSMVGYILGLGDRHPSNLMLDQISGRVLHIDFGDCFEVAMNREKFPEKIPFRLTRMLIKAMEVSGVEGSYRSTCERTMVVLRDNRDSLVAMLEAFVYDPLISWRLLSQEPNNENDQTFVADGAIVSNPSHRMSTSLSTGRSVAAAQPTSNVPLKEMKQDTIEEEERFSDRGSTLDLTAAAQNHSMSEFDSGMNNDRKLKLRMYSDIQNMVANMSVNSRIASITGGAKTVSGSISRSRLGRSVRQRQAMSLLGGEAESATGEALNEKALKVIRRVQDKLTGTDFQGDPLCTMEQGQRDTLDVQDQVQRLIVQATSTENLCQLFIGWCAFW